MRVSHPFRLAVVAALALGAVSAVSAVGGSATASPSGAAGASSPPSAPGQIALNAVPHPRHGLSAGSPLAQKRPANAAARTRSTNSPASVDTLPNFTSTYTSANFDANGNPNDTWTYNAVGGSPRRGDTTAVKTDIVPIRVELLKPDGSVAAVEDPTDQLVDTLASPVFLPAKFPGSRTPLQFVDAVQRTAHAAQAAPDWHTVFAPWLVRTQTMRMPAGSYYYALNPDGSPAAVFLDFSTFVGKVFPLANADASTIMGALELSGQLRPQDVSTFLFENVYLYFGDLSNCCFIGFHDVDREPGDASNQNRERDYVLAMASWISQPVVFPPDLVNDAAPLSHEFAELTNDPFVLTQPAGAAIPWDETPWWQSLTGECHNDMETADATQLVPGSLYPVTLGRRTYHVQTVALPQWIEGQAPSSAAGGVYSYPGTTLLTAPAQHQNYLCQ